MVTYIDPFTSLSEAYSYEEVKQNGNVILRTGKHPPQYGWSMCPCKALSEEECPTHDQWGEGIPAAWKKERIEHIEDDVIHSLLYFHQIPIVDTMYQFDEHNKVFLGTVFDSCGRLTKATFREWNLCLETGSKNNVWKVIRQRAQENKSGYDVLLFNIKSGEKYPYRDGIMIEPLDVFMDWLGL